MDVLSDVLRAVRLSGSVFFTADMKSSWAVESPPPEQLAAAIMPGAEWVVLFHVIADGVCSIELDRERPVWLEKGDVIILPHGNSHVMGSTPQCDHAVPIAELLHHSRETKPLHISHGHGTRITTRLICGYLKGDERFRPLTHALPRLLVVRTGNRGSQIETADREHLSVELESQTSTWIGTSLRYATYEASETRPGTVAMLGRLAELLFIEVLRSYLEERSQLVGTGWLAGLRDPHVGKALQLLHEYPEHPWTVEELGQQVGMSRSVLAERFVRFLDHSPMRYLAAWRMQLARRLMRDPRLAIADIGARVGYESEAAFHRAFKRYVGESPAAWRKRHAGW